MPIDKRMIHPGTAGEQIASRLAGEAADVRLVRACATAVAVVSVLEGYGIIRKRDYADLMDAVDYLAPAEMRAVSELIHAALVEESKETHRNMVLETTRAMQKVATEIPQ